MRERFKAMTNECSSNQKQYLRSCVRHERFVRVMQVMLLSLFLCLWEVTSRKGIIDSFVYSSPYKIWKTFEKMLIDGSILHHIGITLSEVLISFALVVIGGILMAVLLWCSKGVSEILEPYLVILNSLPKSALAPLLIVWLGANQKTIIVAGISVAIFGTILNLYTEFEESSKEKLKLIYTLGGNRCHALTKVVLPGNIPSIISIMKVNIGLCLVGVIIGEFIGAREGLGYLIIYGSQVFKLDWVIMSIMILCIIAMGLYGMISLFEKHFLNYNR